MDSTSYQHTSPAQESAKAYSNSPIPVDSEPKSYPEVVQGPRPGTIGSHQQILGAYDPNAQQYGYDQQWPNGQQMQDTPKWAVTGDEGAKRSGRICGMKRGTFWVVLTAVISLIIIVVLAGILGGVASGSIKTSGNSSANSSASATATVTVTQSATGTSTSATPSVSTATVSSDSGPVTVECPSADGVNYQMPGSSRIFRRLCNVNFMGGEGGLGLQNKTVSSMTECLNMCTQSPTCVGVNFNYAPQCWLKESIGLKSSGDSMESAYLLQ